MTSAIVSEIDVRNVDAADSESSEDEQDMSDDSGNDGEDADQDNFMADLDYYYSDVETPVIDIAISL